MAAFLNGLDAAETDALTQSLLHSGPRVRLERPAAGRPPTSTPPAASATRSRSLLAPLVAACGVLVPMVSGRGLGHTGGTLDKLESHPRLPHHARRPSAMRGAARPASACVMVGQGPDLAPADGLLYALRDVTSTVEFEPFIVSSIVSKKIAEGARRSSTT